MPAESLPFFFFYYFIRVYLTCSGRRTGAEEKRRRSKEGTRGGHRPLVAGSPNIAAAKVRRGLDCSRTTQNKRVGYGGLFVQHHPRC